MKKIEFIVKNQVRIYLFIYFRKRVIRKMFANRRKTISGVARIVIFRPSEKLSGLDPMDPPDLSRIAQLEKCWQLKSKPWV